MLYRNNDSIHPGELMMPEKRSYQIIAICASIAVAFLAAVLMFARSSSGIAASFVEQTTYDAAAATIDNLGDSLPAELGTGGMTSAANSRVAAALRSSADECGLKLYLVDGTGTVVLTSSGEAEALPATFGTAEGLRSLIEAAGPSGASGSGSWEGGIPFLEAGRAFRVARYVPSLGLYLVTVNDTSAALIAQRQQVATLSVILLAILLMLIFLVTSIIRSYRRQVVRLATTDAVTGLANRKSFIESYGRLGEGGTMPAGMLFLLDIDFFKKVNDSFGHAVGDQALGTVAAKIADMARDRGIVGRWGGDEFIGVLNGSESDVVELLGSLVDEMPREEPHPGLHISVSIGATEVVSGADLNLLIEQADEALYQSKKNGRGFLSVYQEGVTPKVAYTPDGCVPCEEVRPSQAWEGAAASKAPVAALERVADVSRGGAKAVASSRRRSLHLAEHLLFAVNRMIPFVAGGGLLIAIAFLIDGASIDVNSLSEATRSNFGSITPLAKTLFTIGQTTFNFMLPIFAAFLAESVSGEEAFVAGFVGGYVSAQGNAGFVGAIVAGLIAALIVRLMRNFLAEMPSGINAVAPIVVYPIVSLLVMYLIEIYAVEPTMALVNAAMIAWLAGVAEGGRVVLGAALGAMMAIDMGGPVNKVAYHFGTAAIASGGYDVMASVMMGGMIPPCGIALSTLLFGDGFSQRERKQAPVTFFMGLSFITEGAIPYLLTDVFRVVPACVAGSAVAGALSAALGCTLMAPHGGIFVFPVVGEPLGYLAALIVGSLVTAVVLGLLKRLAHKGGSNPDATDPPGDA